MDAGIVVLSVDPPITEAESRFIRNVQEDVPKLFFVLNKTDIASREEVSHIRRFLEDELSRLQIESPEIFFLSAREALVWKEGSSAAADSSGIECFEQRLRRFVIQERDRTLVQSVALDTLVAANTLKFAAAIGARARAMRSDELDRKQLALDALLEQTEVEKHEIQTLLRQHSADIISHIELHLTAHVQASIPVVQANLQSFQLLHRKESGRAFGGLLEDFLMREVETVFRKWRVREDVEIQRQLDILSSRFVAMANTVLESLQQRAGYLFEVRTEQLDLHCPLHVESNLYFKVDRVFDSLDSFLLVLPRFLLRPLILRRMHDNVGRMLDVNAGRALRLQLLSRTSTNLRA